MQNKEESIKFFKIRKIDRTAFLFVPRETSRWDMPTPEHPYNWKDDKTGQMSYPDKKHPYVVAEGMYYEHRKAVDESELFQEFGKILSDKEKKELFEPEGKYGIHISRVIKKGDDLPRYGVRVPKSVKNVRWFGRTIETNRNKDNGLGDVILIEGKKEHGAIKFNIDSPILVHGKDFHFSYAKLSPETIKFPKELGVDIEYLGE